MILRDLDEMLPGPRLRRVARWRAACMAHEATEQVTEEEIAKLHYDHAAGAGNGALVSGRKVSSFACEPDWRSRTWPPRDTYAGTASDAALGLV